MREQKYQQEKRKGRINNAGVAVPPYDGTPEKIPADAYGGDADHGQSSSANGGDDALVSIIAECI